MTEVQGELSAGVVSETRYYPWRWRGRAAAMVKDRPKRAIAYEVRGEGQTILLLPAFSSISTRAELGGLVQGLAQRYRVITLDWLGFGESARPAWRSRPAIYQALLNDFVRDVVPEVAGVVACGHSAGYALGLAAQAEVAGLKAIALVAPTWRGPLPTVMGERRRIYALLRWLVWSPLLGQGLYALNTHPAFLRWMMGRHVYGDAAYITPDLMQAKRHTTQAPGARFASAAFVTGGVDPVQQRTDWLDLVESAKVAKLAIAGQQTPPKSGAEMDMLNAMAGVQWATVPGSLAAYEEYPEAVLEHLRPFLNECLGE